MHFVPVLLKRIVLELDYSHKALNTTINELVERMFRNIVSNGVHQDKGKQIVVQC